METRTERYFRRDQDKGITAPNLDVECNYAEHIVKARGKKSRYTSVSMDPDKIEIFGPTLYELNRAKLAEDLHSLIEHQVLLAELRVSAQQGERDERSRALQALRYARMRVEGLIDWNFDLSRVERKDRIQWTATRIQPYFVKES